MPSTKEIISSVPQLAGMKLSELNHRSDSLSRWGEGIFNSGDRHPADISMAGVNVSNSGSRHPAAMTGDDNASVGSGGSDSAVPALDAEILTAVRALNRYPKRGKAEPEYQLA